LAPLRISPTASGTSASPAERGCGARPENEARIPKARPVLILPGDQDPAGGYSAVTQVRIDRYRALGLVDLTATLHPGARHEILNETNRDEVQAGILAWHDIIVMPDPRAYGREDEVAQDPALRHRQVARATSSMTSLKLVSDWFDAWKPTGSTLDEQVT